MLANCSHIEKCDNILYCKSVSHILATPPSGALATLYVACGAKLSWYGILLRILRAVAAQKKKVYDYAHVELLQFMKVKSNNFTHISCIVALKCRINLTA